MALKDKWVDKINGVDINSADDINQVAHAVIELEENGAVDGKNGATFTPSVSAEGVISWTNDQELPNPVPVNIKGATGAQGEKGDKGDTGATGASGSNGKDGTSVTVTNVSESTADGGNNVITFSDGKTVTVKNGSKGSSGTNGVSATHSWSGTTLTVTSASGTSSANLKGDKGDSVTTAQVIAAMTKDTWTFTLEDGSTVTKVVPLV